MTTNRSIVVTGGAGGLGLSVVKRLLAAGFTCHVPVVEATVPAQLSALGDRVRVVTAVDLTSEDNVAAFYERVPELWASVHLAGGFAMAPVEKTDATLFRQQMELNAVSCFLCCRAAAAGMRKAGRGGRMVNVAARPALSPVGGMVAYSASKAAVVSITQSLAEELRSEGIWVNTVAPSIIDTPGNRAAMPTADHARWPKPDEIAQVIEFLVHPNNALISGDCLSVYGRA